MQFLYISLGSLAEIETQLDVCQRLNYIDQSSEIQSKISHINSMLSGLITSLKRKI
ncbi:MAG: four helix bundle protein [Bacteroidetes bacterium]|nr:four helix bundle protein [Bacteroidota bacterium]